MTLPAGQITMIDNSDFIRLEEKVDKIGDALKTLILVEERQSYMGARIGENEKSIVALNVKIDVLEKKLDQWINRGIGVWGVVLVGWAVFQTFLKGMGK